MPEEYHLTIDSPEHSAVTLLSASSGLSKQRIKQAMQKGAVWLTHAGHTQRLRRAKKIMKVDDQLHLYYNERVLATTPAAAQLIADEGDYSVWHKPYGMLSQGSKWSDHCTVYRWAEQHLQPERPAFIVHRLDRAATGLILLAHKKSTATTLSNMFEFRHLEKSYRVVVHGRFAETGVSNVDEELDGRSARSRFQRLGYDEVSDRSLLSVSIETGRKHQIRRHLANIGFPVVGDRLYGREGDECNLQLTACRLQFLCPISNEQKDYCLPAELLPIVNPQ